MKQINSEARRYIYLYILLCIKHELLCHCEKTAIVEYATMILCRENVPCCLIQGIE